MRRFGGFRAAPHRLLLCLVAGVLVLALPWSYPFGRALPWLAGALTLLCGWQTIGARILHPRAAADAPLVLVAACLAGYAWGYWQIDQVLQARLPNCVDAESRSFELVILDEPQREPAAVMGGSAQAGMSAVARFTARVRLAADPDCPGLASHRVRLSWYDPPDLTRGQHWRVNGRLRPPWGYRNGAGFDYERWLLGQRLAGTGYVRTGALAARLPAPRQPVALVRRQLQAAVAARDFEYGPFVLALMIGDDSRISARHWQALRDSGTVHLLVVSGLHVGMVAGLLFLVGQGLSRLSPLLLIHAGSRPLGSALAMAGSGVYVWLSGFGVPAVRAWLMSAVVLIGLACGRSVSPKRLLLLVLAVVVIANPLVVHQQGFWLSFAAVLSLVGFFEPRAGDACQRRTARWLGPIRQLLAVQLVLFVALSPLLALDQAALPVSAPLVNAIAVPAVTLVVLPLVLLIGPLLFFAPAAADGLLGWTDTLLGWLIRGVELGAGVRTVAVGVQEGAEWLVLAAAVVLLGSAPGRVRGAMLAALWWAALLPDGAPPPPGAVRVTALDVGQGSAVVMETRHHRLLYDTGAVYPSGFDLGEAVVVPNLRTARNPRLDALVLSHDDVDHTGGAASVRRSLVPERLWASFPVPGLSRPCRRGDSWEWDRVRFRFLHPPDGWRGSDNDGSCVLLIEAGGRRVLIAGDVSARVERRLPKEPVDLAFAPHHGSASSSSPSFVRGYQPDIVFISTDRRSRYGHPHPAVLARYAAARVFITGRDGALRWESHRPLRVTTARSASAAYWHRRWPAQGRPAVSRAVGAGRRDGG